MPEFINSDGGDAPAGLSDIKPAFDPIKFAEAKAAAATITEESTDDERDNVFRCIFESHAKEHGEDAVIKSMKDGVSLQIRRNQYKRFKGKAEREQLPPEINGRAVFAYGSQFHFDEAYTFCIDALKKANHEAGNAKLFESLDTDNRHLPLYSCIDSELVRLMSKSEGGKALVNFETIDAQTVWTVLNKLVTFIKTNTESGEKVRGKVPEDVSRMVYGLGYESMPQAPEVAYTPLFLSDGTLLAKDGYHYDEHNPDYLNILMVSNGLLTQMPEVPMKPTQEQVGAAVDWIRLELLSDFPFLDSDSSGNWRVEPSQANALAMLLTPFMRRMIHGRTPVFFVYKPQPGTGGTLLGQLPMWLFDGAAGSATRYSQNEEEMQKGLIASVQESRSHLFFDDVKDFNNRELLRAITQANISGRLLGASKNVSVPNRFNWIGTGNNTVILDEMRRRTVFIRLNARMPDASVRQFRHPDVSGIGYTEFVQKHRHIAIGHLLTMIQYWISEGKNPFTKRRRGSFEDWSAKVGGVLQACGVVDGFIDNYETKGGDFEGAAYQAFIKAFYTTYNLNNVQTANAIFDWALSASLDIITGNNEDQKRSRFMKTSLVAMIDRTYKLGGDIVMFQQTMDGEQNIGFRLVKLVANENAEEKAA